MFDTPQEIAKHIARRARDQRLLLNLSQQSLAERSGVSFGVVKKFERTGIISLESLLKIAAILNNLADFEELFKQVPPSAPTLDALMKQKKRVRGRG